MTSATLFEKWQEYELKLEWSEKYEGLEHKLRYLDLKTKVKDYDSEQEEESQSDSDEDDVLLVKKFEKFLKR